MPYLTFAAGLILGAVISAILMKRGERERAERERELQKKNREEEQAALMGTIASGLAHEIRNPLGTLSLNLQLLQEDWASPITEREQKSAKKVDGLLKEVRRLEAVLNDFLRFAAGHKLRLERINVNDLLGELMEFIAPQAARSKIHLHKEFDPAVQPIEADANLLRQAILNLILNAVQAMPDGGDLTARTGGGRGTTSIVLRDTGTGIPAENIDKIFNLYFSTKPAGTGFGLPMARKIVEEHGGSISVQSDPGRGTAFTVSLPTLDAHRPPQDDKAP